MLVGAMNNPHNDLIKEVKWAVKRFDFLDLTLEIPKAFPGTTAKIGELKQAIGKKPVVGHTSPFLQIGSSSKAQRMAAVAEFDKYLDVFERLGVSKVNVHFDSESSSDPVDFNIWTLRKLVSLGKGYGISVMAENTPGIFSDPEVLDRVFSSVPGLLFHLDIAHANIGFRVNQTKPLIRMFKEKLVHVHVSDNSGKGDEHLAIGKGNIDWQKMLGLLKLAYDSTITVEVFANPKERYNSALKLRKIWDDL